MNYIREAEIVLKHYRVLYQSIERMDREIARLVRNAGPRDITAIAIDEELGSGGQDETINIIFEIQQHTENRAKTEQELKKIDKLLKGISEQPETEHFSKVLRWWYIESKQVYWIAQELGYSERHVYRLKNEAIRRFAVRLFGIEALKVV